MSAEDRVATRIFKAVRLGKKKATVVAVLDCGWGGVRTVIPIFGQTGGKEGSAFAECSKVANELEAVIDRRMSMKSDD